MQETSHELASVGEDGLSQPSPTHTQSLAEEICAEMWLHVEATSYAYLTSQQEHALGRAQDSLCRTSEHGWHFQTRQSAMTQPSQVSK